MRWLSCRAVCTVLSGVDEKKRKSSQAVRDNSSHNLVWKLFLSGETRGLVCFLRFFGRGLCLNGWRAGSRGGW